MEKPQLVLMDFDGTLSSRDSFLEFIKYVRGKAKFYLGFIFLSPWLVAYKLKVIPNGQAKERVLKHFFAGMEMEEFNRLGRRFCEEKVPALLFPKVLETISAFKEQGSRIVVISASLENWLLPWADKHQLELLATLAEQKDGKFTGKIKGENCYGEEKIHRLKKHLNPNDYHEIVAFGDSKGDFAMFKLADIAHYRYFNYLM